MPATLQDTAIGAYAGTAVTVATPLTARANDTLLAFLDLATSSTLVLPAGWTILYQHAFATTTRTIYVLRRIVVDEEPATHAFAVAAALVPVPLLVLLVYRGLSIAAPLVDGQATDFAATATIIAPSVTLGVYSDLALGVWYAADPLGADPLTLSFNTRLVATTHGPYGVGSGGTIYIAEIISPVIGATGTRNGTCGVAQTGFAATVALRANPTVVAPFVNPDVQGAIGLVSVGV